MLNGHTVTSTERLSQHLFDPGVIRLDKSQILTGSCTSGATLSRSTRRARKERLTGYIARQRFGPVEDVIWDTELPGFGLRRYPSGNRRWIVRFVERGKARVWTIGPVEEIDASRARRLARDRLRTALLHGLPQRPKKQEVARPPTFEEVCEVFLVDRPHAWAKSTETRNLRDIEHVLIPEFGTTPVDAIGRPDILRWKDGMIAKPGRFNRAVPTLSAVMDYAERLGHRKLGSDPTKGLSRYPSEPKQRFLEHAEYFRLERRLSELNDWITATAIRLLIHTGARSSEIGTLRWKDVNGNRLELPRSKTGRKNILLSDHARALLDAMPGGEPDAYVFAQEDGEPPHLSRFWFYFRRTAGLPDVRLHDLRHSYVSIAVQNGIDLEAVGRLAGHKLPDTTRRYTHLNDACIAEAAEQVGSSIATMMGFGT